MGNDNNSKSTGIAGVFTDIWKFLKSNPIVLLLIIGSVCVGCSVENFYSWSNLNNLISNISARFLVAVGVSGILITKGTDLSAGRIVGLCGCLAGMLVSTKMANINPVVAFIIVVVVGAIFGLINGLLVTIIRIPPFIVTLGSSTIIYGITLLMTNAQPIGDFPDSFNKLSMYIGVKGGIQIPYLLFFLIFAIVLFWFLYNHTAHGKYMYAIGNNEIAARASGVNTVKTTIITYTLAGLLYGIAGYLFAAKAGGVASNLGQGYELEAIAACTIGGVSTSGGIGKVRGVFIGVFVFELLKVALQFLNVNPYTNYIVQGAVILLAVGLDIRKHYIKK